MKINSKYKPLFDLPKAKNKCLVIKDYEKREYWRKLKKVSVVMCTGGRLSSKSHTVSSAEVNKAINYGYKSIVARQILTKAKDSIIPEYKEKIDSLGYGQYVSIIQDRIKCNSTNGEIVFKGLQSNNSTQTAGQKSLSGFSSFMVEEAEELPYFTEWEKIYLSIRDASKQNVSTLVMNPSTKEHWIYKTFFEYYGIEDGFNGIIECDDYGAILFIHTDYRATPKEFIAENIWNKYESARVIYERINKLTTLEREKETAKNIKTYKFFKHTILGGWLERAEGAVYEDWVYGEFDNSLSFGYGMDFGFKDPDTCVKVAVDKRRKIIYLDEVLYKNGLSTDSLVDIIKTKTEKGKIVIADCAEPRLINDIRRKGVNVKKCKKGKDAINRRVKKSLGYKIVITKTSNNLVKEFNNYCYADKGSKLILENGFDHLMDAWQYYFEFVHDYSITIK